MMKILGRHQVSPPPNSVEETKYPLTHFDIPCTLFADTETILFYDFPHQQTSFDFTQNIVPKLKQSLSLALRRFPCLVGSLVLPSTSTSVPYISYQEGDSIPLVIAQSNADFDQLVKDDPKDSKDFCALVPDHQRLIVPQEAAVETVRPLLAIQVTIFSNSGISICFKLCHVVGDGRTRTNFIKSWASIFKTTQDGHIMSDRASQDVPLNDQDSATARQVVISRDLLADNLRSIMWDQLRQIGSTWDDFASRANNVSSIVLQDKLHATFKLGTGDVNKLKEWLMKRFQKFNEAPPLPYASTFVVTCAFIWVCLIKADISSVDHHVSNEDNSFQPFFFAVDCTRRTEFNIPESYCGNCVMPCEAWVKKNELLGENGLFIAAKAIMQGIKNLDKAYVEAMKELIPKLSKVAPITESMTKMSVTGSPKFLTYETDFGWGKPRKSEMVQIDKQCEAISLTDTRDDKGGVEVGVSLKKVKMNAFSSIFHLGLKNLEQSILAP